MGRPPPPADPVTVIAQALAEALRLTAVSNAATPEWRTLSEESRVRGFPSVRAFRDWCYRVGVEIREPGGVATVAPADVDRVFAAAPTRTPPPSAHAPDGERCDQERLQLQIAETAFIAGANAERRKAAQRQKQAGDVARPAKAPRASKPR